MLSSLLVLLALAVASAASAVEADDPLQWRVENTDKVIAGEPYELHNTRRGTLHLTSQLGFARWERSGATDQDDIAWTGHSGGHFVFVRTNTRDHRTITPDEVVALYNTKIRKYMTGNQYRDRRHKSHRIQGWSSSPAYEWMVHQRTGADFALYNTRYRDYFVLGDTFNGVDATLTWRGRP